MALAQQRADLLLGVDHVFPARTLIEMDWTERTFAWLTPRTFFLAVESGIRMIWPRESVSPKRLSVVVCPSSGPWWRRPRPRG